MRASIHRLCSDWMLRVATKFIPEKKGAVALTFHNISAGTDKWLMEALGHIKNKYGFMDPSEFAESMGKTSVARVLLTFDDGFSSNKRVAETALARLNIKALFFITHCFIGLSQNEAFKFAQEFFYPSRPINERDGSMNAMDWKDVQWLISQGHEIGAHTYLHRKLAELSIEEMVNEIVNAANSTEEKLGRKITKFAYPFGSIDSIDEVVVKIASERFNYAFSNLRGMIDESPSKYIIYRQNVTPGIPMWKLDAIIEGKLDWLHSSKRTSSVALNAKCKYD